MSGNMEVSVASGDALDVREFSVHQQMSSLFNVTITALSKNADIDFEAVIGKEATFKLHGRGGAGVRTWKGICSEFHQLEVEESGASTYHFTIVPKMWLTTQRRNHRMFQQMTELDIAKKILGEWGVEIEAKTTEQYKKRKYRVQYGESDYTFISRMLEDAGITFYFEEKDGETKAVLADAPQSNEKRGVDIPFRDEPTVADKEHVTAVRLSRRVRPGKYTMRDHDYRRPADYKLIQSAGDGGDVEDKLERFHYTPGAFLFSSDKGEDTPHADDKGKHRTDEGEGGKLAQKRLDAKRNDATVGTFQTNVIDLAPGTVMSVLDHPHSALADGKRMLVVESRIDGRRDETFSHHVEVRGADKSYHPPMKTPKPRASGVESATVVGPAGEEIHTDEFGRVRVHFHWDRESKMDDNSSCWIHVNQPWGGAGYGGSNLPRIGQEVIVDFLGGDPDRPVITGRVYTNLQKTPYKLPANKTQSGLKSNTSPSNGGYNEMMFEDAAGKELIRMQAEKDLHKLVKNDENVTIGRDRTKLVKNNDDLTVGKNRTKSVVENERETIGQNHNVAVGVNRATQVGQIDSTIVGQMHTMMVSPPGEGDSTVDTATSITTTNKLIVMKTPGGAATITMSDSTITLEATTINITAKGKFAMTAATGATLTAAAGDMVIKGAPKIKLNP
jgi:type VI secretion system secreted protein VgrG